MPAGAHTGRNPAEGVNGIRLIIEELTADRHIKGARRAHRRGGHGGEIRVHEVHLAVSVLVEDGPGVL
jgi:hypothetical protein